LNSTEETTAKGVWLALLALVVIWGLTYTPVFLRGWVLLGVDALLLALLLILTLLLQPILLGSRDSRLLRWWALGAALLLATDVPELFMPRNPTESPVFWFDPLIILVFIVSLSILGVTTLGVNPSWILTRGGRNKHPKAWTRFFPAIPLLIGVIISNLGVLFWSTLDANAIRSVSDAMDVAQREGFTGDVQSLCMGAITPEYFSSISQVIPLLLVALGIERRFFERFLREAVQRAVTIFTVLVLSIGELLALSVLPSPNQRCGTVLSETHELVAFTTTLTACSIGLTLLFWALVAVPPLRGRDLAPPAT
jgi:hypothetical protein